MYGSLFNGGDSEYRKIFLIVFNAKITHKKTLAYITLSFSKFGENGDSSSDKKSKLSRAC